VRKPAVIFDLDGTLIDSAPDLQSIASDILITAGCAPLTLAEARLFMGNGASVFVERMCHSRDIPPERHGAHLKAFLNAYETAFEHTLLYPGVLACLEKLTDAGHSIGLCTNRPLRPTHAVLSHFSIIDFFTVIVAGDTTDARKPDPKPLKLARERLGQASTIYIGDSEVDAETAARADITFLLFTGGYRKAAVENIRHSRSFDSFAELPIFLSVI
jgi:phosphoglycolate phosphatase